MENAKTSWWEYAQSYDVMCEHNPYYQANLEHFSKWLSEIELKNSPRICEVGAGTGNFLKAAGKVYPHAEFFHWDWNSTMNAIAKEKYSDLRIEVEIQNSDIAKFPGDLPKQDVMLALNSLYTFPDVNKVLSEVFNLLNPGGYFYTIDIGRPLEVTSWLLELINYNRKKIGVRRTLKALYDGRHAISANRSINQDADSGSYWRHETEEFEGILKEFGFEVVSLERCYRDSSDRAICRKPN